jgi:hypothetical protein
MESEITGPCSINHCPRPATHHEVGESTHWRFFVQYCDEHHREAELGTPLGPVGIDASRVQVHAKGVEEPATGGILPTLGPQ